MMVIYVSFGKSVGQRGGPSNARVTFYCRTGATVVDVVKKLRQHGEPSSIEFGPEIDMTQADMERYTHENVVVY